MDLFTIGIVKNIVLRSAKEFGYSFISEIALNILAEAVIERISAISRLASKMTTHSGRIDTNAMDVFFSLAQHGETVETLTHFFNTNDSLSRFEFVVEPYPIPQSLPPGFPTGTKVRPFRSNFMPYSRSHIPRFLPPPTEDNAPIDFPEQPERAELIFRSNQADVSKALSEITHTEDRHTTKCLKIDAEMKKMIIDGSRNDAVAPMFVENDATIDPELLPWDV